MNRPSAKNRQGGSLRFYVHRAAVAWIGLCSRRAGLILLLCLGLWGVSMVPVLKLELHSDMAELLPDQHPAVVALRRIAGRQKASTNLALFFESPDAGANLRLAEALKPEFQRLVPSIFTEVQWSADRSIPEYAQRWKWLYAPLADLESAEQLLDRLIAKRTSPLVVDLEGDPEKELNELRARLEQRLPAAPPSGPAGDYFTAKEEGLHYLGVMLWRHGEGFATLGDHETVAAVQAVVERIRPTSFHPQMKVAFTGPIAMAIDEHNAIRDDLTLATALCGSLVLLVIYLYFRRLALLIVVGAPAVLGLFLSLALGQILIRYLNANTAFLISIILGNGINTPIIVLARYGEERRRGAAVNDALITTLESTMAATATAMLAASIAYGCLLLTSFRGFNQFGLIGATGMIFVWLMTFVLVPPMVIFGERLRPGCLTPRASLFSAPFRALGRLAVGRPLMMALISLGLLLVAAPRLASYVRDPFEWDFSNLRNKETQAQRNWGKMYSLGMGNVGAGHIATDAVLLVDRPEQADVVAEALRQKDRALGPRGILKEVRTLSSMLPDQQPAKLELLARLRRKLDRHRDLMSESEWKSVEPFRPADELRLLGIEDLPRAVRENFTEVDGQRGRLIGIDADPTKFSDWNGHDLLRLAEALRVEALGQTWVAAASSTVFGGMLETIVRDGPRVTLAALLAVTVLAMLSFGLRSSMPVLVSLLIGIGWTGGIVAALKLKLNFVNFVALPITLGVGMDYASNIWARLQREGTANVVEVVADTGSAVALCSLTTIIGYSSLLLANNRALQSFGLLADLGEVCCLIAALVALPALVRLGLRLRSQPSIR